MVKPVRGAVLSNGCAAFHAMKYRCPKSIFAGQPVQEDDTPLYLFDHAFGDYPSTRALVEQYQADLFKVTTYVRVHPSTHLSISSDSFVRCWLQLLRVGVRRAVSFGPA